MTTKRGRGYNVGMFDAKRYFPILVEDAGVIDGLADKNAGRTSAMDARIGPFGIHCMTGAFLEFLLYPYRKEWQNRQNIINILGDDYSIGHWANGANHPGYCDGFIIQATREFQKSGVCYWSLGYKRGYTGEKLPEIDGYFPLPHQKIIQRNILEHKNAN